MEEGVVVKSEDLLLWFLLGRNIQIGRIYEGFPGIGYSRGDSLKASQSWSVQWIREILPITFVFFGQVRVDCASRSPG